MKTVYVVGIDYSVKKMFEAEGWVVKMGAAPPADTVVIDLVCFTGGSDVSPHLYDEENISSHCDPIRDEFEVEVFEEFKHYKKVGICRGGQFLNVMSGGKMIQHIDGHSMGYYPVVVFGDFDVPYKLHEDHHQGMIPADEDTDYVTVAMDSRDDNHEILWYPKTKSLCFQAHPEWGHDETKDLFFELLKEYLEV